MTTTVTETKKGDRIRLAKQQLSRAAHFFVHFFAVVAQLLRVLYHSRELKIRGRRRQRMRR